MISYNLPVVVPCHSVLSPSAVLYDSQFPTSDIERPFFFQTWQYKSDIFLQGYTDPISGALAPNSGWFNLAEQACLLLLFLWSESFCSDIRLFRLKERPSLFGRSGSHFPLGLYWKTCLEFLCSAFHPAVQPVTSRIIPHNSFITDNIRSWLEVSRIIAHFSCFKGKKYSYDQPLLFWDATQRWLVHIDVSGRPIKGQSWPLQMGPLDCSETSVPKY